MAASVDRGSFLATSQRMGSSKACLVSFTTGWFFAPPVLSSLAFLLCACTQDELHWEWSSFGSVLFLFTVSFELLRRGHEDRPASGWKCALLAHFFASFVGFFSRLVATVIGSHVNQYLSTLPIFAEPALTPYAADYSCMALVFVVVATWKLHWLLGSVLASFEANVTSWKTRCLASEQDAKRCREEFTTMGSKWTAQAEVAKTAYQELSLEKDIIVGAVKAQRDAAVRDGNTAVRQRDSAIEDRNTAIAEKVTADAERDTAIEGRNAAVEQRDVAIEERNTAVADKVTADAERDTAIEGRDAAVEQRDLAIEERNTAVAEKVTAVAERDTAIEEKEAAVQAREVAFTEKTEAVTENVQLKETNTQLVEKNRKLTVDNEERAKESEAVRKVNRQYLNTIWQLKGAATDNGLTTQRDEVYEDNEQLARKNVSRQRDLRKAKKEDQSKANQIKQLQADKSGLQTTVRELQSTVTIQSKDNQDLRRENTDLQAQHTADKHEIVRVTTENVSLNTQVEEGRLREVALEKEIGTLRSEKQEADTACHRAENNVTVLSNTNARLTNDIVLFRKEQSDGASQLAAAELRITRLEDEQESTCTSLRSSEADNRRVTSELLAERKMHKETCTALIQAEGDLQSERKVNVGLRQEWDEVEAKYRQEVEKERKEKEEEVKKRRTTEDALDDTRTNNTKLTETLDATRDHVRELQSRNESLTGENVELRAEVGELQGQVKNAHATLHEQQEINSSQRVTINQLQNQLTTEQQGRATEVSDLRAQLQDDHICPECPRREVEGLRADVSDQHTNPEDRQHDAAELEENVEGRSSRLIASQELLRHQGASMSTLPGETRLRAEVATQTPPAAADPRVEELEHQLATSEDIRTAQEQELKATRIERDEALTERDEARRELGEVEGERDQAREEKLFGEKEAKEREAALESYATTLEKRAERERAARQQADAERIRAEAERDNANAQSAKRVGAYESELTRTRTNNRRLRKDKELLQAVVEHRDETIKTLSSSSTAHSDFADLRSQNDDLRAHNTDLERMLDEQFDVDIRLTEENQRLKSDIEKLRSQATASREGTPELASPTDIVSSPETSSPATPVDQAESSQGPGTACLFECSTPSLA